MIQCVFHMSLLLYFICFVSDWECWVLSFLQCSMRNVLVCEMMIMVFVASCDISNYKCYVLFCSCVMLFLCIFLILRVIIILISLLFCFYFIVSWVLLCNTYDVILIKQYNIFFLQFILLYYVYINFVCMYKSSTSNKSHKM